MADRRLLMRRQFRGAAPPLTPCFPATLVQWFGSFPGPLGQLVVTYALPLLPPPLGQIQLDGVHFGGTYQGAASAARFIVTGSEGMMSGVSIGVTGTNFLDVLWRLDVTGPPQRLVYTFATDSFAIYAIDELGNFYSWSCGFGLPVVRA